MNPPSAWRDGAYLVLSRAAPVAPDRCIVTNAPVFETRMIRRRLTWGKNGPGGVHLPTEVELLCSLADMKKVTVTFGLSEGVKARRMITLALAFAAIVGGGALFAYGLMQGFPPKIGYLGAGAGLAVIALTLLANTYTLVDIVAMNEEFVWLRGAKPLFLDSLPVFQGR